MEKDKIDEIKEKLIEINEIISSFSPEIRASAFDILAPYYFEDLPKKRKIKKTRDEDETGEDQFETDDIGSFISSFDHKQPKNNVLLIVAWLYNKHGVFPISTKLIKEIGNSTGLVIPSRPDMTLKTAKKKGKTLFSQIGKGWQLTVSGETFLRETYHVKKGNKPLDE